MATISFLFNPNLQVHNIDLNVSRKYKILTVTIIAGTIDNLENSVHLTSLYFLETKSIKKYKFKTTTLKLNKITDFKGLVSTVEFPAVIVFDKMSVNATISVIPEIFSPILSIEIIMEDFT